MLKGNRRPKASETAPASRVNSLRGGVKDEESAREPKSMEPNIMPQKMEDDIMPIHRSETPKCTSVGWASVAAQEAG